MFKSELPIGVHSLMDGGCRQRHQRSLPAAAVAVLFVMGLRVKERVPNAGGREQRRRDHKAMVVPVLETRVNSRGKPDLFVFVCYSGDTYAIDKMKCQSIHC